MIFTKYHKVSLAFCLIGLTLSICLPESTQACPLYGGGWRSGLGFYGGGFYGGGVAGPSYPAYFNPVAPFYRGAIVPAPYVAPYIPPPTTAVYPYDSTAYIPPAYYGALMPYPDPAVARSYASYATVPYAQPVAPFIGTAPYYAPNFGRRFY